MQAKRNPKCRTKARLETPYPGYLEEPKPDPGGADADPDGEGSNHPSPVMHDVVAADRPDSKHQTGQEPQAEHHRSRSLRQSAEREQAAEDQRKDAADHARSSNYPTEPSMEGVVPAADPVGQLDWCQE